MAEKTNEAVESTKAQRETIRTAFFSARNFKKQIVKIDTDSGEFEVEVRQPTVEQILRAQEMDDRKYAAAWLIVSYCYVPGTNERLFDEEDIESILHTPFNSTMVRLQQTITQMTQIRMDVEGNA